MPDDARDWNLDDILDGYSLGQWYSQIRKKIGNYHRLFKAIKPSVSRKKFAEILVLEQELYDAACRINVFTDLRLAVSPSPDRKEERKKADKLIVAVEEISDNTEKWIRGWKIEGKLKGLDEKNYQRLKTAVPGLEYLLETRRSRKELTEDESADFSECSAQKAELTEDYQRIMSHLRFQFKPPNTPQVLEYSYDDIRKKLVTGTREERKTAEETLYSGLRQSANELFANLKNSCKSNTERARASGYSSIFEERCSQLELSCDIINTILAISSEQLKVYERYFKHKAKILGAESLESCDLIYVAHEHPQNIPLNQSLEKIILAFDNLSSEFAESAKRVIDENHLRTIPLSLSSQNALSMAVAPEVLPYVQVNYLDTIDDYVILAHELGHAAHFWIARRNWPSLFEGNDLICETISTFSEMLALDVLVETSPLEHRKAIFDCAVLNSWLYNFRAIQITEFEKQIHAAFERGESSIEEISAIYAQQQNKLFNNSVAFHPDSRYDWMIRDVFESPFYWFNYCFGQLAAMQLYQNNQDKGKEYAPKIINLMRAGNTKPPLELLQEAGVNLTDKKQIEKSFQVITTWMDQLEK